MLNHDGVWFSRSSHVSSAQNQSTITVHRALKADMYACFTELVWHHGFAIGKDLLWYWTAIASHCGHSLFGLLAFPRNSNQESDNRNCWFQSDGHCVLATPPIHHEAPANQWTGFIVVHIFPGLEAYSTECSTSMVSSVGWHQSQLWKEPKPATNLWLRRQSSGSYQPFIIMAKTYADFLAANTFNNPGYFTCSYHVPDVEDNASLVSLNLETLGCNVHLFSSGQHKIMKYRLKNLWGYIESGHVSLTKLNLLFLFK